MGNVANAILIVGTLALALIFKDEIGFFTGLAILFSLAVGFLTWETKSVELRRLTIEKNMLEIRKLRYEIEKLKKEVENDSTCNKS